MDESKLPYQAKRYLSKHKTFSEIIVFVHFYEGSAALIKRHVQLVNSMGFDAVAFDLLPSSSILRNPLSKRKYLGIKHIWADQIESILNAIPEKKILFSFSNPSASAIEALYY
ncbi:MAG: hypothetical protein KDD45_04370, partial [Bdellovibrionales bacterium]|nr:hypothetical protein [Bdellovibrionales bacterium]